MSEPETNTNEIENIELWNMALIDPKWYKPWHTVFYVDSPQYLSFNLFDKYSLHPFFFREKEMDGCKYIGIMCCIRFSRLEDFLMCMHELQRNMMICGYNDYEEFCREVQAEMDAEDEA